MNGHDALISCKQKKNKGSVQFSPSVASHSQRPHGLQYTRLPCPSPNPGVYSNSCPVSQWCIQPPHPLSSLLLPLSIFPNIRVFSNESILHIRSPEYWCLALAAVLPMNTQYWTPLGWTGWISLQSKGLSRVFSNTTVENNQFFCAQMSL